MTKDFECTIFPECNKDDCIKKHKKHIKQKKIKEIYTSSDQSEENKQTINKSSKGKRGKRGKRGYDGAIGPTGPAAEGGSSSGGAALYEFKIESERRTINWFPETEGELFCNLTTSNEYSFNQGDKILLIGQFQYLPLYTEDNSSFDPQTSKICGMASTFFVNNINQSIFTNVSSGQTGDSIENIVFSYENIYGNNFNEALIRLYNLSYELNTSRPSQYTITSANMSYIYTIPETGSYTFNMSSKIVFYGGTGAYYEINFKQIYLSVIKINEASNILPAYISKNKLNKTKRFL